jgi:leader peptidase (prepilin peptidase) / N-methyltransferase
VNPALVAGCGVAGAAAAVWLPVDVVASDDGRTVADGPRPMPGTVLHRWWGRAMVVGTAALWAGLAARVGTSWDLPPYLVVGAGLVALTVVDLRQRLLPRRIVWPLALAALALFGLAAGLNHDGDALGRAVLCAAGAYAVFFVLRLVNPAALGGGDVTLAAVLGLALGWRSVEAVLSGFAVGVLLAAGFALVALAARRVRADTALSYGPFLAAGAMVVILAAPSGRLLG